MSHTRTQEVQADFRSSILKSAFAAGFAHPARVLLNRASLFPTVKETFVKSIPYLLSGLPINVLRGGSAIGLQDYVNDLVKQSSGHLSSTMRSMLGITATSGAGTIVAATLETCLIRKTNIDKASLGVKPKLWRITPSLPAFYFAREVGFTVIVFNSDNLPSYQKYPIQLGGACYTGMMHKFASLEAVRDLLPREITIPHFAKDGFAQTISAIAHGKYTHPSMQVKYKNPDNLAKKTYNFFQAACGMRMFVFRCGYLGFFMAGKSLYSKHQEKVSAALKF